MQLKKRISKFWRTRQTLISKMILATTLVSWLIINPTFLKPLTSFTPGKWVTWESVAIHISQIALIVLGVLTSIKKLKKPPILFSLAIILIGIFLLTGQAQTTTTLFIIGTLLATETIWQQINLETQTQLQILLLKLLKYSSIVLVIIGLGQIYLGQDLGLQIFGEPILSSSGKGISILAIGDINILRAYSLFPHPNIFGYFCAFTLLAILLTTKKYSNLDIAALTASLGGLLASGSRASIYLLIVIALLQLKTNQTKRNYALASAGLIVGTIFVIRSFSPLTIQSNQTRLNEITSLFSSSTKKILPWEIQPIHNSYIEVFLRLPIISLITTSLIVYYRKKLQPYFQQLTQHPLLVLTLLWGLTDHFFISLPIGSLFLCLTYIITTSPESTGSLKLPAFLRIEQFAKPKA